MQFLTHLLTRQDCVENRDKVCFVVSVGKETFDLKRLYFGSGNIKKGTHIHQPSMIHEDFPCSLTQRLCHADEPQYMGETAVQWLPLPG